MSDIEQLDELVYLLPVGVVSFIEDGSIEMANPLSVQLRNPLVPPAAMGNAFTCLAPLVPGLALRLTASGDAPLVVARRRSALQVFGQARVTVELSIHRTRPGHFVAILADVTSLTRQEQAVRRERDRIRLIVEMVHAYAIYPTDRDGVIDS